MLEEEEVPHKIKEEVHFLEQIQLDVIITLEQVDYLEQIEVRDLPILE